MKKLIYNFNLALLILLPSSLLGGEIENLKVFTEDYPPYNFLDAGKNLQGISVDLLRLMEESIPEKRKIKIKFATWARGYKEAQRQGRNTMLFSTTRTSEREKLFKWVGPIGETSVAIFSPKSNVIKIDSEKDLAKKGMKFTAIKNDIGHLLLLEKGVKGNDVNTKVRFRNLLRFSQKRGYSFAYEENAAKWLMVKYGYKQSEFVKVHTLLANRYLYYSFNKTVSDKVIETYQKSLDKIKQDKGTLKKIIEKYHLEDFNWSR